MTVFDMLKELQEQEEDEAAAWIVVWDINRKRWACSLVGWDQTIPGWDRDGPRKLFYAGTPYDCVHKAWKSEKEAEVRERAELERLREMHGMVREAEEKPQTPEEIRAELDRLRELFGMEKEAGE